MVRGGGGGGKGPPRGEDARGDAVAPLERGGVLPSRCVGGAGESRGCSWAGGVLTGGHSARASGSIGCSGTGDILTGGHGVKSSGGCSSEGIIIEGGGGGGGGGRCSPRGRWRAGLCRIGADRIGSRIPGQIYGQIRGRFGHGIRSRRSGGSSPEVAPQSGSLSGRRGRSQSGDGGGSRFRSGDGQGRWRPLPLSPHCALGTLVGLRAACCGSQGDSGQDVLLLGLDGSWAMA